jgi:KDO2-lipid IV(A) lauroyltransferase
LARHGAIRNRLEWALARSLVGLLRRVPLRAALGVARGALGALDLLSPKLRRTAFRNLEMALPETGMAERRRIVEGCFRSLARLLEYVARFPEFDRGNIGRVIRYEGFEHFEEAKKAGKGVLFATAHLGNWELSAFAHGLMAEPMSFVVRPLDNPLLDEFTERYRTMSGNQSIGRGRDFLRPLIETLRRNEAVGILADQNVLADRGVFVEFFGIQACVDAGLAKLAWRTGAAVIPGYAVWSEEEGRYVLIFEPPVPMTGDAVADTQAIHRRLEAAVRRFPDQWLWIHRRWKTRPEGEPPLY